VIFKKNLLGYTIILKESAKKDLRKLPPKDALRIENKISELTAGAYHCVMGCLIRYHDNLLKILCLQCLQNIVFCHQSR